MVEASQNRLICDSGERLTSGPPEDAKEHRTSLAPMLSVGNGAKAIEFYKAAFGVSEAFRHDGEEGSVVARLSIEEPNSESPTNRPST